MIFIIDTKVSQAVLDVFEGEVEGLWRQNITQYIYSQLETNWTTFTLH